MINQVILIGTLLKKNLKTTKYGDQFCQIELVTSKTYKSSQGINKTRTAWHVVNFYRQLAERAYMDTQVGETIFISGENDNRIAEENGKITLIHTVRANEFKILKLNKELQNVHKVSN